MLSQKRVGRITSSEIYKLMKKGRGNSPSVVTETYLAEKRIEKRLGRSLNADISARPTLWGTMLEPRLYSMLNPFEYEYCSTDTIIHPEIDIWAGTPDFTTKDKVCDGKCPYTLKSFCEMADMIIGGDYRDLRLYKPEYYWQLISNSVLTNKKQAELIIYCPYKSELPAIKEMLENMDEDQTKYQWVYFTEDDGLPYLPDGGYYKNLYSLTFDVPTEDVEALRTAVLQVSL